MSRPVGLLVVGYGRRGRQWHETCRGRTDVTVVGVVEPDPATREAAASGGLAVFDSPGEAAGVSAAIVASPPESHPPAAVACLAAGLAVLVEKPLALSTAAATLIVDEASRRGRVTLVGQNFRYLRRERAVGRALADGLVGRPVSVDVESSRAVDCPDPLWDFAIHHLDVFCLRWGGPEVVSATPSAALDVVLTWADGLQVRYRHDDAAAGYVYRERLVGTDGTLTVDDQHVRLVRDGRRTRTVRGAGRVDPDGAVLDEFLRAIAGGPDDPIGPVGTGRRR